MLLIKYDFDITGAATSTVITDNKTEEGGAVEVKTEKKEADVTESSGKDSDDDEVSSGNQRSVGRWKPGCKKITFANFFIKSNSRKRK